MSYIFSQKELMETLKKSFDIEEFDSIGISNYCFITKDGKEIIKATYDSEFLLFNDFMINAELVKNNITIPLKEISNKFFVIMDFLPNYKSKSPSEYKNDDLDKVIELIKKMHSIDTSIKPKTFHQLFKTFYKKLDNKKIYPNLTKLYKKVESKRQVFSHLDLVSNNILFNEKKECILIDFDMALKTDYRLDILSLITENEFSEDQKNYIIDKYFESEKEKEDFVTLLPILTFLFDYLWYIWAEVRKSRCKDKNLITKFSFISDCKLKSARKSDFNKEFCLI